MRFAQIMGLSFQQTIQGLFREKWNQADTWRSRKTAEQWTNRACKCDNKRVN